VTVQPLHDTIQRFHHQFRQERPMHDDNFDQNFTWHEWTFVAPSDPPAEEIRGTGDDAPRSAFTGHADWDEDWRWTT
jgi:hypothetical protein